MHILLAEGSASYSPADVAAAFRRALGRTVEVGTAPPESWVGMLEQAGFSAPAARSMAAMSRIALQQSIELPRDPVCGDTTIDAYVAELVGA